MIILGKKYSGSMDQTKITNRRLKIKTNFFFNCRGKSFPSLAGNLYGGKPLESSVHFCHQMVCCFDRRRKKISPLNFSLSLASLQERNPIQDRRHPAHLYNKKKMYYRRTCA